MADDDLDDGDILSFDDLVSTLADSDVTYSFSSGNTSNGALIPTYNLDYGKPLVIPYSVVFSVPIPSGSFPLWHWFRVPQPSFYPILGSDYGVRCSFIVDTIESADYDVHTYFSGSTVGFWREYEGGTIQIYLSGNLVLTYFDRPSGSTVSSVSGFVTDLSGTLTLGTSSRVRIKSITDVSAAVTNQTTVIQQQSQAMQDKMQSLQDAQNKREDDAQSAAQDSLSSAISGADQQLSGPLQMMQAVEQLGDQVSTAFSSAGDYIVHFPGVKGPFMPDGSMVTIIAEQDVDMSYLKQHFGVILDAIGLVALGLCGWRSLDYIYRLVQRILGGSDGEVDG